MAQTARLFLALWPQDPVRSELARWGRAWRWPAGARPVEAQRLHVTLHFIGPVAVERVGALREGLHVPFEPFDLALPHGAARVWPGGIAVLELEAPAPLQRLHAALAQALHAAGLPVEERRFRPHVTFARKAAGAVPPATPPQGDWRVDGGYALVHSVPARGYAVVHTWPPQG